MKTLAVVLLSALSLLASCAAGPKKVVVASDTAFPPMEFLDEKRTPVGFDIELTQAIAKAAGFEVEFRSMPWDGIFSGLSNGDYDAIVSSVTITDVRRSSFDFSRPYLNAGQVAVVPVESAAAALADLKGQPVGAQLGSTGAAVVEKTFGNRNNLKAYDEIGLAFEDLFNRRLAGLVIDTPVAAQYVLRNAKYRAAFKIIGKPLTEENYGVVVKKGNQALLALFDSGLEKVQADGTYDQIKARWLP